MKLLAVLLLVFSACDVTLVPVPQPSVRPEPSASPSPSSSVSPSPEPSGIILNCQNVTFNFEDPNNAQAKTYVLFDLNADGTHRQTGMGGNGNLGNSAQDGADCCRPPATPILSAFISDADSYYLGLYAYGSGGYELPGNPIIKYNVLASERGDCWESWP